MGTMEPGIWHAGAAGGGLPDASGRWRVDGCGSETKSRQALPWPHVSWAWAVSRHRDWRSSKKLLDSGRLPIVES